MTYSSLMFIYGFLPLTLLIYYVCPRKLGEYALLLLSLVFCAFSGLSFLLFICIYTLVNYGACILTERLRTNKKAAAVPFLLCCLADIAAIVGFRGVLAERVTEMMHLPPGFFPIGISFFTLSAIGMLCDVYSGRLHAERNIVYFALYMIYFPRLIMGPVLRYDSFKRYLLRRRGGLSAIGRGLTVFVRGLAKKVIAADSLYMLYTAVRGVDAADMAALTAWLGVIAYILCLYFTLSGCADMGMGISACFGIKLPPSFNYPLFSSGVRAMTSKWHIQIVLWFRRYVLKPLYSLSSSRLYKTAILIAVWLAIGFWYTFSLNGIVWGFIISAAIIVESRFAGKKIQRITGIIYTFMITVIGGAFLGGDSIADSLEFIFAMLGGGGIFADQLSFYLLKSYVVLILICIYASTSLFGNMLLRAERTRARTAIELISPFIILLMLMICTALISYVGSSELAIIRL